jgi:predicted O-methyltransferase YrrM
MTPNFSADWFSHNIPVWRQHILPQLPQNPSVLEIGSHEGRSALWMLDNIPGVRLTCVDPFFADNEPAFDANIGDRVEKIKSRSQPFLFSAVSQGRMWDMVYIDGDHEAKAVLEDFVLSWHCLPVGGLCVFDDYPWTFANTPERKCQQGPAAAVNAVLEIYRDRLSVIHIGYQVVVKKTDDYWEVSATSSGREP